MVKTRVTGFGMQVRRSNSAIWKRFGKDMTHRKETETKDDNERVIDRTNVDVEFRGDLQYGPNIDKRYATQGSIDVGDAILFVNAADGQASNMVPLKSIIVEGTTAGTYDAWEIVSLLNKPQVEGGQIDHYEFRCRRRTQVTLS